MMLETVDDHTATGVTRGDVTATVLPCGSYVGVLNTATLNLIIHADILCKNVFSNTSTFLYTVRFHYVQYLPEHNQDRSKHVGVMTEGRGNGGMEEIA